MPGDLDDILEKFVPKRLFDELRRDYDRLLIRVGRMEEQLLMLSDYGLEKEEDTESIDRRIRRVERARWRRARAAAAEASRPRPLEHPEDETLERRERRAAQERRATEERRGESRPRGPARERPRGGDLSSTLDESLADESTEELIRRLRQRYREISRLRERLRDEEE
jgi:hypothetical protein